MSRGASVKSSVYSTASSVDDLLYIEAVNNACAPWVNVFVDLNTDILTTLQSPNTFSKNQGKPGNNGLQQTSQQQRCTWSYGC